MKKSKPLKTIASFLKLLVLGLSFTITLHAATLEDHLVLRLRFDGDAKAEPESFFSGERNHSGIGYSTDAIDGSALDLASGEQGYVAVFNPPQIEDYFTVSFWFKLPEGNPVVLRGLFSWGPEGGVDGEAHGLFITALRELLTIQNFGSSAETRGSVSVRNVDLSEWNHIAYSYSAVRGIPRAQVIYVNGNQVYRRVSPPAIVSKGSSLIIGANPVGGFEIFPGLIDDFRLYDKPLTQSEVQALIDEQIPRISIERIPQGKIISISNPKLQMLELFATDDFKNWESVHATGTTKAEEFFFDNQSQDEPMRFYSLRQKGR